MALPVNPLSKLIGLASASVAASQSPSGTDGSAYGAVTSSLGTASQKAALDSQISAASGGLNSPLNGVTGGGRYNIENWTGTLSMTSGQNAANQTAVGGIRGSLNNGTESIGTISNSGASATDAIAALTGGGSNGGSSGNGVGGSSGGIGSGLAKLAGALGAAAAAAGQINNLISLARGFNLPSGAELFKTLNKVKITPSIEGDWRVRLNCDFDTLFGKGTFSRLTDTAGMVFPFTPNMSISSKANYSTIDPVHSNFPFQAYKNSAIEDIQISGEFPCENEKDAEYYLEATMFLRSATKMFYGSGNFAGNPPVICQLSGYGPQILNTVPVVVKSFSMELKDDVNYIKVTKNGKLNWVPVLSTISITVSPVYNRERLRKFSLQDFAAGKEIGIM